MAPRGGIRANQTGRPRLPEGEKKTHKHILVQKEDDEDLELEEALKQLTPEERREVLLDAARAKQAQGNPLGEDLDTLAKG